MRKYKCPSCHRTASVIKYGRRNKSLKYYCKLCKRYFSVNPIYLNTKQILSDHLDGLSFRKLAIKYDISPMTAWRICEKELKRLPDNNQFSFNYCNRFSSVFVIDGKYFNIAERQSSYVLLWGIDYYRHDIPVFYLAPSENYHAWSKYFFYFRLLQHRPEIIVCDDNVNLKMAARSLFPQVRIQTCFNHFKESIRRNLKVRSDNTYKPFMERIERIFESKINDQTLNTYLFALFRDYRDDPVCLSVITNIKRYMVELTAYRGVKNTPVTTNIIEGLNSHLEARLVGLRSFQTVSYAKLWMNGYILKRRFTKWTDCKGKFKKLNGKTGVKLTSKHGVVIPTLF